MIAAFSDDAGPKLSSESDIEWTDIVRDSWRREDGYSSAALSNIGSIFMRSEGISSTDVMEFSRDLIVSEKAFNKFEYFSRQCVPVEIRIGDETWFLLFPKLLADCTDPYKTEWISRRSGTRTPRKIVLDSDKCPNNSVFRVFGTSAGVFCDRHIMDALKNSGLNGFEFQLFSEPEYLSSNRGLVRHCEYSADVLEKIEIERASLRETLSFPEMPGDISPDGLVSLLGAPAAYAAFLHSYPANLQSAKSMGPDPTALISRHELMSRVSDIVELNRLLWTDASTQWSQASSLRKWPREYIAIGEDMCGNYFLVKSGDESGAVWFYNHDGGTFTRRYAHIDDFVKDLQDGTYKAPFGPF